MSPTTDLLNDPLADNFRGPGQWVWPLQQNSVSCSLLLEPFLILPFLNRFSVIWKTVISSNKASSYGDDVDTTAQLYINTISELSPIDVFSDQRPPGAIVH